MFVVGRLGKDVELRVTPSNVEVASFSVATSDKNKNGEEKVEWHNVVVFGKTAVNCHKFLKKGSLACVEGKIQTESWDDKNTGVKRTDKKLYASHVTFLSSPTAKNAGAAPDEAPHDAGGVVHGSDEVGW
jgi:single-strand DNA-binding protein